MLVLFVLLMTPQVLRGQGPPIRGEGGAVQYFQGNVFRTFATFDQAHRVENPGGEEIEVGSYRQFFVLSRVVAPGLAIRVNYPLVHKTLDGPGLSANRESVTGWGDVEISAKYRFFFHTALEGRADLALISGVKLPTGSTRRRAPDGSTRPRSLQPGSGSTDFFVQLSGSYVDSRRGYSLFADIGYRENTEDASFELGDIFRFDLGGRKRLWPARFSDVDQLQLFAELALEVRHKSQDRLEANPIEHTEATTILLSPGVSSILKGSYLLEASFQHPLWQGSGSALRSDWNLLVGLRLLL